jgi:iron(III) transport system substrate-binding protein
MKRALPWLFGLVVLVIGCVLVWRRPEPLQPPYPRPSVGAQTLFPARDLGARLLTIEGATDVSFMRPFIVAFQATHPDVSIQYVDMLSSELLTRAQKGCDRVQAQPDLYVTIATDHLVALANHGCGRPAPKAVAALAPAAAQWRREVIAFSLEPAVFVYDSRAFPKGEPPLSHLALVESLRADPLAWRGRIGTYDIEQSGPGYNYASFDARQAAIYGRLIESFGRSLVRTYCCSNEMVDAVGRGEIRMAYNVQLSYAYAGQRRYGHVGVVLPSDYQAIQTRSVMMSRDARNPSDATAFVQLLVSPRGQLIAREQVQPPRGAITRGALSEAERASQEVVGSSLLSLRDPAKRGAFIREWRRALYPPPEARTP